MQTLGRTAWEQMNRDFEAGFWGTCTNTASEEHKQYSYAELMGLHLEKSRGGGPWFYDVQGHSILDVGGGPSSMLLKTRNWGDKITVVDPAPYPDWVRARYECASIDFVQVPAEEWEPDFWYDEAWIYNCIQHVMDPRAVIDKAKQAAKRIRIAEWVCWPPEPGHPHTLWPAELDEWLGAEGAVALLGPNYEILSIDEPPREHEWNRTDITEYSGPMYHGVFDVG